MKLFDFFRRRKSEVKLEPRPLLVNPPPERVLLRRVGRLMRLHRAAAKGHETPEMKAEIRKLRLLVQAEGYLVDNEAEAAALYKQLGGA